MFSSKTLTQWNETNCVSNCVKLGVGNLRLSHCEVAALQFHTQTIMVLKHHYPFGYLVYYPKIWLLYLRHTPTTCETLKFESTFNSVNKNFLKITFPSEIVELINLVIKIIISIWSKALDHRLFYEFLEEIESTYSSTYFLTTMSDGFPKVTYWNVLLCAWVK